MLTSDRRRQAVRSPSADNRLLHYISLPPPRSLRAQHTIRLFTQKHPNQKRRQRQSDDDAIENKPPTQSIYSTIITIDYLRGCALTRKNLISPNCWCCRCCYWYCLHIHTAIGHNTMRAYHIQHPDTLPHIQCNQQTGGTNNSVLPHPLLLSVALSRLTKIRTNKTFAPLHAQIPSTKT